MIIKDSPYSLDSRKEKQGHSEFAKRGFNLRAVFDPADLPHIEQNTEIGLNAVEIIREG